MVDDLSQRPIVIKRIKKVAGGHHGGASYRLSRVDAGPDLIAQPAARYRGGARSGARRSKDLRGGGDRRRGPAPRHLRSSPVGSLERLAGLVI